MAKQPLNIIRGTTNSFSITLTDEEGNPYVLEEGQEIVFGIKKKETDADCIIVKRTKGLIDGAYQFTLNPDDTLNLTVGKYFYDVGIQHGAKIYYNIIESSSFMIEQNITKIGDGL